MKDRCFFTSIFLVFVFSFLRLSAVTGVITIDIDLPDPLKKQLNTLQKTIQNVCFSHGCYPNMLPKDNLKLTVQLVTDTDLSEVDLKKVQQAVEQAAQTTDPFNVIGKVTFGLMPYRGAIENFNKWRTPRDQYPGDWVVLEVEPKGQLANLLKTLQENLINAGIMVIKHKPLIAVGFTRFTEVKKVLEQKKGQIQPIALGFQAHSLQINKTTLARTVGKGSDRINISKQNLGSYPLGKKIMPEDELLNALNTLKNAFDQLLTALQ